MTAIVHLRSALRARILESVIVLIILVGFIHLLLRFLVCVMLAHGTADKLEKQECCIDTLPVTCAVRAPCDALEQTMGNWSILGILKTWWALEASELLVVPFSRFVNACSKGFGGPGCLLLVLEDCLMFATWLLLFLGGVCLVLLHQRK